MAPTLSRPNSYMDVTIVIWLFIKKLCTVSPHLTLSTRCWNCSGTMYNETILQWAA